MSHRVAPTLLLPAIMQTSKPAANPRLQSAAASGSSDPTTTAASADGGLDSTFLNLLVQELQNQDPTAPMDSTAMVGQMISLNQLDQLISINQTLTTASTATATGSDTASAINAMGAANAVNAPAKANGTSAVSTIAPGSGTSVPVTVSDLLRSLHGPEAAPIQPVVSVPVDANPIFLNSSTFGDPGFDGISGGK